MGKIYVAGNLLLRKDSLPLRIMPKLLEAFPKINFIEFDPTENFPEEKELIIIDTVLGLKKIEVFTDMEHFSVQKPYSLHDFDLGLTIRLLKKIGRIEKVTIIGVPSDISQKEALLQVTAAIKKVAF